MKQAFLLSLFSLTLFATSFGQKPSNIVGVRMGYSSTNIVFKEAFEPSLNFFGYTFKTGKTFVGNGPELGITKDINCNLFLDLAFSSFNGKEIVLIVNANESQYTLSGYQIPLTINYLIRNSNKRFRFNAGVGVQYLKGHLQQFETVVMDSGQTTNQITDIKISEWQIVLRPGIQFRIIPNLFASFIVNVSISTNGRYSDHPCFSIKYIFKRNGGVPCF